MKLMYQFCFAGKPTCRIKLPANDAPVKSVIYPAMFGNSGNGHE